MCECESLGCSRCVARDHHKERVPGIEEIVQGREPWADTLPVRRSSVDPQPSTLDVFWGRLNQSEQWRRVDRLREHNK